MKEPYLHYKDALGVKPEQRNAKQEELIDTVKEDMPAFAKYSEWQQKELANRAASLAQSQEQGAQR